MYDARKSKMVLEHDGGGAGRRPRPRDVRTNRMVMACTTSLLAE